MRSGTHPFSIELSCSASISSSGSTSILPCSRGSRSSQYQFGSSLHEAPSIAGAMAAIETDGRLLLLAQPIHDSPAHPNVIHPGHHGAVRAERLMCPENRVKLSRRGYSHWPCLPGRTANGRQAALGGAWR
jgi:hypothetical protein